MKNRSAGNHDGGVFLVLDAPTLDIIAGDIVSNDDKPDRQTEIVDPTDIIPVCSVATAVLPWTPPVPDRSDVADSPIRIGTFIGGSPRAL